MALQEIYIGKHIENHREGEHLLFPSRRHRRNLYQLPSLQNLDYQNSYSLGERLNLIDLIPQTHIIPVEKKDIIPFSKAVVKQVFSPQSDLPRGKRIQKSARTWLGFGLGSVAFWGIPWPKVSADSLFDLSTLLRAGTTMAPYFFLNLPDSLKIYSAMGKSLAVAIKQLVTLPILLTRYAFWNMEKRRQFKKDLKEGTEKLHTIYPDETPRALKEITSQVLIFDQQAKIKEATRKNFVKQFSPFIQASGELLPTISETDRITLLQNEVEIMQKRYVKQTLLFLTVSLAIPLATFGIVPSVMAMLSGGLLLPHAVPFIIASLLSLAEKKTFFRIFQSSQEVKKQYSREKLGKELLLAYSKG